MTQLIIILVCLLINMLLSGSEMAFVTVSRQQLKRIANTNRSARIILNLKANPERTLSVIQIGITLVGAIAAAVGGAGAEEALSPLLMDRYGLSERAAEVTAILMVVIPISYFNIVVGELFPKSMALRHALPITLWSANWLFIAERVLSPFVNILEFSTNILIRFFTFGKSKSSNPDHHDIAIEDLQQQAKQYVVNIVSADKKVARDIMLPWKDVIYINKTDDYAQVETVVMQSRHTRLPVMSDNEVIGIINTKEFLALRNNHEWQGVIRPILKFKSFEPLFKILVQMQEVKSHLAVIYDQTRPVGLLTMEDIFEEIIGDVFDEDDDELLKKIMATKGRRRPL